ncbi:MAG: Ig-like domain-containing protein [Cyclobacteriaceae bacterium]|nr:Ig-like domain-containing protein [Cyclobacteriaceae bacterium]
MLQLATAFIGSINLDLNGSVTTGVPVDQPVYLTFSSAVDRNTVASSISISSDDSDIEVEFNFLSNDKGILVRPLQLLTNGIEFTLTISNSLKGAKGENFSGQLIKFKSISAPLTIQSFTIGDKVVTSSSRVLDVPLNLTIAIEFSVPVNPATVSGSIQLQGPGGGTIVPVLSNGNKTLTISRTAALQPFGKYTFSISNNLEGANQEPFQTRTQVFYAAADPTPKFPIITDEELLTLVQQQTFKYFWDFAHPASGMARERNTSNDLVTSGGSGFGIMAIIVGIERGFITRQQGIERLDKILDFLETADRFHGVWSHWINGNTGAVIPFSANDNGGDLVETSFLIQGLITFRQYLNAGNATENELINRINALWQGVEWDWYRRDNQQVLYWHWSADKGWAMNMQIKGWNECLITYFLAAASPTHSIPKSVYDQGWASNGGMQNGNTYEGVQLPLGYPFGGPLFFTHYSFLGLDPRNLSDAYANYWVQNVNHSLINYKYCVRNPKQFVGYKENSWGLTASDNHTGYSAHSPTNDLGVITPTAALSSFPYTPDESMEALKFFYYIYGDKLWGNYGFYDAFNITEGWVANSYLAIDQGPIIIMIENYRTGLLWDLFMSAPEVQTAMTKLGFTN